MTVPRTNIVQSNFRMEAHLKADLERVLRSEDSTLSRFFRQAAREHVQAHQRIGEPELRFTLDRDLNRVLIDVADVLNVTPGDVIRDLLREHIAAPAEALAA